MPAHCPWRQRSLQAGQSPRKKTIDEYDPGNIKLSHRQPIRGMSDDDLLFLKQIGMKWARVEFGNNAPFDYMDMYQVIKALRKVKFSGTVVPDHVPLLVGDTGIRRAGTAYCIAYMRSLLRRANEEVG